MFTVLQINTTYNWGSHGRIAEEIGQLVINKGGNSYVAYGRHYNKGTSVPIRIGSKRDVYQHVIQTRLFDKHGLASQKATKKLIDTILKIKPDIIHLHNIHGYYINYPILFDFLSKYNVPVVWTLHDCWSFTGHCSHYVFENCHKWQTICNNCPQLKQYPISLGLDRSTHNHKDKQKYFTSLQKLFIVPVSNWLAQEVNNSFLKNYPQTVIHNGINLNNFNPKNITKCQKGIFSRFVILGVASIWTERKGLNDFIKLRKLLSNDYIIILVGLSSKQIKQLPTGIIGIQRTNSVEELAEYYSIADVFLNPTWEDTFPTTNLEALACGTPVITYQTGGSTEAIDANTGVVIKPGDLKNLAEETIKICNRKDKEKISYLCRQRAISLFDKNLCYEAYYRLYQDLLK